MNQQAIYIHVPWCRRRCPYCNFYFVVGKPDELFKTALIREWRDRADSWQNGKAQSLYFGGGTPSLLRPQEISYIINFFMSEGALDTEAEITLEANPEDLTAEFMRDLRLTQVNRISLGVQSFDDQTLRFLGRMHTGEQAFQALDSLKQAGINNISVDLIIGVPHEKPESILQSIGLLDDRLVGHISTYLLTIEEKTNFHKRIAAGSLRAPCEDAQVEMYRAVQVELKSRAYEQYDISSFAKPGLFSRHNQVYWSTGSYIGLGPGAHSMRVLKEGAIERAHNKAELKPWLLAPSCDKNYDLDRLTNAEALKEALAFGLRNMHQGIDPHALAGRHHHALPASWLDIIENFNKSGWLINKPDGRIAISSEGALFADAIMREIVSA